MKTIYHLLIVILFITSCKGQKLVVDSEQKDIIAFEFKENNVKHIFVVKKKYLNTKGIIPINTTIYNKKNIIVITQKWKGYGPERFDKIYSFQRNKDTMNIHCECGQERNNYFKNIRFQKGNYKLSFKITEIKEVLGHTISTTEKMQNTLFKNTYAFIGKKNNTEITDLPFKELSFYKISLGGEGVVWKKLEE